MSKGSISKKENPTPEKGIRKMKMMMKKKIATNRKTSFTKKLRSAQIR
jgi:hypothetical protein